MARSTDAFRAAIAGARSYRRGIVRLYGLPESEIANTLRAAEEAGVPLEPLEITTCLRRGEIEVATRYEPAGESAYASLIEFIAERHGEQLFSRDGSTVDAQVASLLSGRMVAVAESCTGGLMSARSDRAARVLGVLRRRGRRVLERGQGVARRRRPGPDRALRGGVERGGGSAGVRRRGSRFDADVGVGITGIAGPDGGTEDKPVGTVCFSVCLRDGARITRRTLLPGSRSDIRDRSTTVAMHLMRRLLVDAAGACPTAPLGPSGRERRGRQRPTVRRARAALGGAGGVGRGGDRRSSARFRGCVSCGPRIFT